MGVVDISWYLYMFRHKSISAVPLKSPLTIPNRQTSPILFFRIHPSKLLTEGLGAASDSEMPTMPVWILPDYPITRWHGNWTELWKIMHKYEHGGFAGTGKVWKGYFEYPEQGIVHQPLPAGSELVQRLDIKYHQMTSALCVLLFVFLLSLGFLACEAESATVNCDCQGWGLP